MIREARERKPMCGMVLRGIRDEKNLLGKTRQEKRSLPLNITFE